MESATFIFHGDLIDFLSRNQQDGAVVRSFREPVSVKHLIESQGVPHTEIEHIRANGKPVTFAYLVGCGDQINVFPPHSNELIAGDIMLSPPPPMPLRFLLDNHLGRLAAYLRLLGFDAQYDIDLDDAELACISHQEQRILLTRDRGLLMRRMVDYGYCLRTREPRAQLEAVIRRFDLTSQARPWRRCLTCNGILQPVSKESILHRLEPRTILYYENFHRCLRCEKVYWKGSHYLRMKRLLDELDIPLA